jgi:arylsulfatase A-like enzyme
MKRRDFLKSTAAVTGGVFSGLHKASARKAAGNGPVPGPQPNILFILVDELRFPTVFPEHIKTPGEYLKKYMPNLHKKLWKKGVKFGNYHTAANACTPSRGVIITGLYSQQSWLVDTILSTPCNANDCPATTGTYPPTPRQPVLNHNYPTYGKLLRRAGYQTPYVGKWHVSVPTADSNTLENYGFDYYKSYFDPTGDNFQGTYGDEARGYHSDEFSANNAIEWLKNNSNSDQPWCLTVGFVNPHDREFFPAGTEFQTYDEVFADPTANPRNLPASQLYSGDNYFGPVVPWDQNALKSPPPQGFPTLPPNWEDTRSLENKKLKTQIFFRELSQLVWGGITDDPSQDTATVERYPSPRPVVRFGVGKMPFSYWQRGLDSYAQITSIVDCQIGRVLDALEDLPQDVQENTVVIFASDHGEYDGAHGFVQGKIGSVYEEAWHIPLIVYDPSGRFTGDIEHIRTGLASHVDFSTMLVSIGNRGTRDWMTGNLAEIYGNRHDMISMLRSAKAPGRPYVLYATDETAPNYFNFNAAPTHILGLRTEEGKLGVYAEWVPLTSHIIRPSIELEFYDYSTSRGQLELDSRPDDPSVRGMVQELLNHIVPNELQQKLPGSLGVQQQLAKIAHLAYREFIQLQPDPVWQNGGLQTLLGLGREF